jgi:hypothetical protein
MYSTDFTKLISKNTKKMPASSSVDTDVPPPAPPPPAARRARPSRRALQPPTSALSTCSFRTLPVTRALGAHLVVAFVQHMLFMREQIPCTYTQLQSIAQRELQDLRDLERDRARARDGLPPVGEEEEEEEGNGGGGGGGWEAEEHDQQRWQRGASSRPSRQMQRQGRQPPQQRPAVGGQAKPETKPPPRRRKRRRLRAGFRKKAVKAVGQLGDLFAGIRRGFDALAPTLVVVAIGSSVSTAREKFALHFAYTPDGDAGQGGVHGGPLTEQHLASATRVLIRGIFQNSSELFHHSVRTGKVFVAMRGAEGQTITMPQQQEEQAGDPMLLGGRGNLQFLPDLRLLPLRRKRGGKSLPTYVIRVRGLNSRVREGDTAEVEAAAAVAEGETRRDIPVPCDLLSDEGHTEIWYRWPQGVKGLRKPPGGAL